MKTFAREKTPFENIEMAISTNTFTYTVQIETLMLSYVYGSCAF